MTDAVLAGRTAAEALMIDACTIDRAGAGQGAWNDTTGTFDPPARTVVYGGRCKLQTRDVQVATPDVAGREVALVEWALHLPVGGTAAIRTGDSVTITTSALDAALVGTTFTVLGPHLGTAKTARRLPLQAEVSSWA